MRIPTGVQAMWRTRRHTAVGATARAAATAALLALVLIAPAAAGATEPTRAAPAAGTGGFTLKSTADLVRVRGRVEPAASRVVITLEVAPGHHVNANPASLDFLVPTRVEFAGAAPLEISYPAAKKFRPSFTGSVLDVYEGEAVITAVFASPDGLPARGATATVTAQACNDTVCYPPSRMEVTLGE